MNQDDFRSLLVQETARNRSSAPSQSSFLFRSSPCRTITVAVPDKLPRSRLNHEGTKLHTGKATTARRQISEPKERVTNSSEYERLGSAKGLDFTLLEKNKSAVSPIITDEDILLSELVASPLSAGNNHGNSSLDKRKRSRYELVEALKDKRQRGAAAFEVDDTTHGRKRNAVDENQMVQTKNDFTDSFNIFEGVPDYNGVVSEEEDSIELPERTHHAASANPIQHWFEEDNGASNDDSMLLQRRFCEDTKDPAPLPSVAEDNDRASHSTTRLTPLVSSTMRSITDVLSADHEIDKAQKRRTKKEKRKGKVPKNPGSLGQNDL